MAYRKYQTVLFENEDGIGWVYFNRPEKRNAMSPQLCFEMVDLMSEIAGDPAVKVVVLTGKGPAWTAGMDLKEFFRALDNDPAGRLRARDADRTWNWYRLSGMSKPTIAMVNGFCFGGGFTPLAACDFAIAADDAIFGLSEINWGILPGGLVSKVVCEMMTYRKALYYACTGETFTGKEAEQLGVVTKSVPRAKLRAETVKLAKLLMSKPLAAVQATKEAIRMVRHMPVEEAYDYLQAKGEQLRFRDQANTRTRGINDFIDQKRYRPGFQSVVNPKAAKGAKAARPARAARKTTARKAPAKKKR
jgi:feruloyl-CoA hydratase/lyase